LGRDCLRRLLVGSILASTVAAAACSFQHYVPQPLEREGVRAAIEARDPDAPAVLALRRANGAEPPLWPLARYGFDDLVWVALADHPDLLEARARVRVAQAGGDVSRQRPNPTLRTALERHSDRDPGDAPWGLVLELDLPLVDRERRAATIEQASLAVQLARIDTAQVAWRLRSRLLARHLEWRDAVHEVELADEGLRLREELVAMIEKRIALGYAATADLGQEQLRLGEARALQMQSRRRLEQARGGLAEALAISRERFDRMVLVSDDAGLASAEATSENAGSVAVDALVATRPDPRTLRAQAIANRLDIERALLSYAASEAALRLEIARQYPDLALSPGYHFEPTDLIWSVGLALALPVFHRNEARIAESEARRQVQAEAVRAVQSRAVGEVDSAASRLRLARTELQRALADREAAARRQRAIEGRFDRGGADRRDRVLARIEGVSAAQREREARHELALAASRVEDSLQRPLTATVTFGPGPETDRGRAGEADRAGAAAPHPGQQAAMTATPAADPAANGGRPRPR
jgi:outer membrane protein TolC